MTKARMDWKHMILELDGHAGSAPYGQDIVCAAISMLSQALLVSLMDLQAQYSGTYVEWSGSAEEGRMKIKASVSWMNLSVIRAHYNVAVTGMRMLADKYPEYITLEEV